MLRRHRSVTRPIVTRTPSWIMALCGTCAPVLADPPSYDTSQLPGLGGDFTVAEDIDATGRVVGFADTTGGGLTELAHSTPKHTA